MSIILEAKNIYKTFDETEILSNINLSIKENSSIAIIGASGEGKTTLLHILGTLERPTKGNIYICNKPIKDVNILRNTFFGFIFQSYNLFEDLTILENVILPAKIARKNYIKKAISLLKELNLENKKDYPTKILSGGEKQRVAIARAFCLDPKIILADEPTGNLDSKNSEKIHHLLLNFVNKKNKSLILVTHDEELASFCDEKFILKRGKLIKKEQS
ncbi:MAG: hypothetical protein AMS24_01360 [Chlamydiae bacterium SM23_39]|nr:MAG: hypothetical protein AMS24_01360 [Chlamydiae bacterium SM23_39]